MQFITSLFGGSGNSLLTALFALGIVVVLIILGVWLLKLVFTASGNVARGRNRRLAVIDTLSIDPKRQLLIIRRDNVEHLILTGGQQDLVVETGIPVEEAPAQPSRRPLPVTAARPARPLVKPAAEPVAPVVETPQSTKASAASAIERLRDLGRPAAERQPTSLRHTGLMRSLGTGEASDKSDQPGPDSAKEEAARQGGTTELDDQVGTIHRGERKADGF